jgi:hypothetical protein
VKGFLLKCNSGVFLSFLTLTALICCPSCNGEQRSSVRSKVGLQAAVEEQPGDSNPVNVLAVIPFHPAQGEAFRIVAAGTDNLDKATIEITGAPGGLTSVATSEGGDGPYWKTEDFGGLHEGRYSAVLKSRGKTCGKIEFEVSGKILPKKAAGVWRTLRGWDSNSEFLYSAWVSALFGGCDESSSWKALHEVTRNRGRNFLFNSFSLGEDGASGSNVVIMQPDCADNPFFLRAYFSWKLGLPFGFHLCTRGYLHRNPEAGDWITNETASRQTDPVAAFNAFMRRLADGVHSGTARTGLSDEHSDYYPVPLERKDLRPGTVYADPYGHTLILTGWINQSSGKPGVLLAVDAQPDGTVGIKRFWKGNFLFNTSEVVGEPGFKAFRPLEYSSGGIIALKNEELTSGSGFVPFSLQQKNMDARDFYHRMERLINPEPLDPVSAMLDQIQALYEQLQVRITSVSNGENYMKAHPGTVIPMPTNANGIFLAGGQWEDFSTPNRDLRLLIAMDAVEGFPDRVADFPQDFKVSGTDSPDRIRERLRSVLNERLRSMTITYTRSDGSHQELTLTEIIARKDAFEMAYNPNDGIEIRWGAPENSAERSVCRRHAPPNQAMTMKGVRNWFHSRLHPPT